MSCAFVGDSTCASKQSQYGDATTAQRSETHAVGDAKVEAVLEVELRYLRRDEDERNVAEVLDVAQALDDIERVDEDGVKVARLGLVELARLFEPVDDGDLESELLDRLGDARVVVERVDEEDPASRVRDESLLPHLLEVPLANRASDRRQGEQGCQQPTRNGTKAHQVMVK